MKLIAVEEHSEALRADLTRWPERASSLISEIEVKRTLRRGGADDQEWLQARGVLASMVTVGLTRDVIETAVETVPAGVRALDAIHLASALSLGDDLGALFTYDQRMAEAATSLGLPVAAPA